MRRRQRYLTGRARGAVYRLSGRHPDPDVPDQVLAQRVRSTLGPIRKRFGVGRVGVVARDHAVSPEGVVSSNTAAKALEDAALDVAGVARLTSRLRIGAVRAGRAKPETDGGSGP